MLVESFIQPPSSISLAPFLLFAEQFDIANIFIIADLTTKVLVSILDEPVNNVRLLDGNGVSVYFLERSSVSVFTCLPSLVLGVQLSFPP